MRQASKLVAWFETQKAEGDSSRSVARNQEGFGICVGLQYQRPMTSLCCNNLVDPLILNVTPCMAYDAL